MASSAGKILAPLMAVYDKLVAAKASGQPLEGFKVFLGEKDEEVKSRMPYVLVKVPAEGDFSEEVWHSNQNFRQAIVRVDVEVGVTPDDKTKPYGQVTPRKKGIILAMEDVANVIEAAGDYTLGGKTTDFTMRWKDIGALDANTWSGIIQMVGKVRFQAGTR